MARKPVNQHRMLTAVSLGRVAKVKSMRWCGSWQFWDASKGRWRPVSSGENKALDAIGSGENPMISEAGKALSDVRSEYGLTEYGRITLTMWDHEMGPVAEFQEEV